MSKIESRRTIPVLIDNYGEKPRGGVAVLLSSKTDLYAGNVVQKWRVEGKIFKTSKDLVEACNPYLPLGEIENGAGKPIAVYSKVVKIEIQQIAEKTPIAISIEHPLVPSRQLAGVGGK